MTLEGPPSRPPIPPTIEKAPETAPQPEVISPEQSQGVVAEQNPKSEEQLEAEKIKAELQAHRESIEETGRQIDTIDQQIEAIKKEKGYEVKGNIGTPEDILAALIPNKKLGLENLNKMLASLADDSEKARLGAVIRDIERLSDEEVKNMASSQSFSGYGLNPARFRYDGLDYDDLSKITGSQNVGMAVNEYRHGQKKVQDVREKIDTDPDIANKKAAKEDLRKKFYSEIDVANSLESRLQTLEAQP